jgi:chromosome segregation ATPase
MGLHFFEMRKLPRDLDVKNELLLMLSLFRVNTEEELKELEDLGGAIVREAINAYREIVVSPEFRELERLRREALSNEASALETARILERRKLQGLLADKDAKLADKDVKLADKDVIIADKNAKLADKDVTIADKDAKLADKDVTIADKDAKLADKDVTIADKDAAIAEQAARIAEQAARIAELEALIS